MPNHHRAFTLVELAFTIVVAVVLVAVLLVESGQARNASGIQGSIDRLRRITGAAQVYHLDHAGQVPLRGDGYSQGQITGGWDTWEYGGKNCSVFWQSYGAFDESAYSRPLNSYLYAGVIPVPIGYVNSGSGSTWQFQHGHPAPADRMSLQLSVFQSPGDRGSFQESWPIFNPNISCYNDVGTSYMLNMAWWDQPGLPPGFTPRFNEGTRRIGLAFDGANPNYAWIGDQTLSVGASNTLPTRGEWGKLNAGVVGFADGRVEYMHIVPGALSGPGYTLLP